VTGYQAFGYSLSFKQFLYSCDAGDLRFKGVHQGYQLLRFGHDPTLLGKGFK